MANFKVIPQSTWLAKLSTLTASQLIYGDTDGTVTQSSSLAWDATNSTLKLGGAATSANSKLAILASKTVSTVAAATVWKGLDVQTSTITLTAGGTAPSRLDMAYLAAPVITQTAGTAYTVAACSTLYIAGPPTASAAGGGTPTLTAAGKSALEIASGVLRLRPGATNVQSITLYSDAYGIGMDGASTVIWGASAAGVKIKAGYNDGYNGGVIAYFLNSGGASADNYFQFSSGATGTTVTMSSAGADDNVNITITPKGAGGVIISSGSVTVASLAGTGSRAVVVDANGVMSAP